MLRPISPCAIVALAIGFGDPAPARAGNEPERMDDEFEADGSRKLKR